MIKHHEDVKTETDLNSQDEDEAFQLYSIINNTRRSTSSSKKQNQCQFCFINFDKKKFLKIHLLSEHRKQYLKFKKSEKKNLDYKFQCDICEEKFTHQAARYFHIKRDHPNYQKGQKNKTEIQQNQIKQVLSVTTQEQQNIGQPVRRRGRPKKITQVQDQKNLNQSLENRKENQQSERIQQQEILSLDTEAKQAQNSLDNKKCQEKNIINNEQENLSLYKCIQCGFISSSFQENIQHETKCKSQQQSFKQPEQNDFSGNFKCNFCSKQVSTQSGLKKHLSRMHKGEKSKLNQADKFSSQGFEKQSIHSISSDDEVNEPKIVKKQKDKLNIQFLQNVIDNVLDPRPRKIQREEQSTKNVDEREIIIRTDFGQNENNEEDKEENKNELKDMQTSKDIQNVTTNNIQEEQLQKNYYKCQECHMTFTLKDLLEVHIQKDHKEKISIDPQAN